MTDLRGRPVVIGFFASWCSGCAHRLQATAAVPGHLGCRARIVEVDTRETGNGARYSTIPGPGTKENRADARR